MADISQLHEINPAQAPLDVTCERLGTVKGLRELRLSETCFDTALL